MGTPTIKKSPPWTWAMALHLHSNLSHAKAHAKKTKEALFGYTRKDPDAP
jgi:hypothetical protein